MRTATKPRVRVVKFGDGYEQRSPDGLNSLLRSYSPVFRAKDYLEAKVLDAFFTRHGSWKAFLWRSPMTNRTVKVVCRQWDTTTNNIWTDFHCQFDEVIS